MNNNENACIMCEVMEARIEDQRKQLVRLKAFVRSISSGDMFNMWIEHGQEDYDEYMKLNAKSVLGHSADV